MPEVRLQAGDRNHHRRGHRRQRRLGAPHALRGRRGLREHRRAFAGRRRTRPDTSLMRPRMRPCGMWSWCRTSAACVSPVRATGFAPLMCWRWSPPQPRRTSTRQRHIRGRVRQFRGNSHEKRARASYPSCMSCLGVWPWRRHVGLEARGGPAGSAVVGSRVATVALADLLEVEAASTWRQTRPINKRPAGSARSPERSLELQRGASRRTLVRHAARVARGRSWRLQRQP